jgi:hypothetical protein
MLLAIFFLDGGGGPQSPRVGLISFLQKKVAGVLETM